SELVDLAVGIDAGVGLADARFAKKRRLATITRARVQFHWSRWVRRKPGHYVVRIIRDASEDQVDCARQEIVIHSAPAGSPALSPETPRLVPASRTGLALAKDR